LAVKVVLPEYPLDAIKKHQTGVAVALVYTDDKLNVSRVDILQAPSPVIANAVRDAVSKWKFRAMSSATARQKLIGKLTFYFLRYKGKYQVLNPQEAPNLKMVHNSPS